MVARVRVVPKKSGSTLIRQSPCQIVRAGVMAVTWIRNEPTVRAGSHRRARLTKPAALGLAYVGVAAGRIVGEEVRAYWRLHQLTRALAHPDVEADVSKPHADR